MTFIEDSAGDLKKTFGPVDIFNYIYAILHSPTYRKRYAEFLKIDFPRIPLTAKKPLFRKLAKLGAELVGLHLLESDKVNDYITTYPVKGTDIVDSGSADHHVASIDERHFLFLVFVEIVSVVPGEEAALRKETA